MTLAELVKKAEEMMYSDYRIHAGIERKVVIKEWIKEDKKRKYIKIYCYTLNGRYKGSYDCGYYDDINCQYVPGEINLDE